MSDLVQYSVSGHIATVAFNRPDVLNALTTEMLVDLVDVFDDIEGDPRVWCVVVKGNGRAFSVGADMKERRGMSADAVRHRRRIGLRAFSATRHCTRPVIAQTHGYALGSGLELTLGCDIAIVAEGTTLGLVETRVGAIPAGGGTQLLPRLVGLPRAKELIFTGRRFSAEEALGWRMVNTVVPLDRLEATVQELAEEITKSAPIANTQAKLAMNMALDVDIRTGMEAESALYERTLTSRDRAEAVEAFNQRRSPNFTGQ
jgi:enoyl-CoA hydratase/carnithine racemase